MVEPGTMLIKVIHRIKRGGWRKRDHTQRIQYRSLEKPAKMRYPLWEIEKKRGRVQMELKRRGSKLRDAVSWFSR